MQVNHVPTIGKKYWAALILASIFGANTGDFLADGIGLGHIYGLPFLAALFAIVMAIERYDSWKHVAYFWAAIIIIRTSATNIGDIGHDLHIKAPPIIAGFAIALFITILIWASGRGKKPVTRQAAASTMVSTVPVYWFCMLLAGALGTVLGDYFSFGLKFGTLRAAFILGIPVALTLLAGGSWLRTRLLYYFLAVVLIRAAGTAAGDYMAKQLSLPVSTIISGIIFVGFLTIWREAKVSEPEYKMELGK
jgi:hypothetical protein